MIFFVVVEFAVFFCPLSCRLSSDIVLVVSHNTCYQRSSWSDLKGLADNHCSSIDNLECYRMFLEIYYLQLYLSMQFLGPFAGRMNKYSTFDAVLVLYPTLIHPVIFV